MADPFGILGVIGVATQLIQISVQFGLDWKDAPSNARAFFFELESLRTVLRETHNNVTLNPDSERLMSQALELASRGLAVVSHLRGPDSLAAASAMGILGEIVYHGKDYAKARSVEEKVLSIRTRVLGEKNHFTLQAKDDLAITLAKQGDYTKAANMHEQVRKIRLETLGSLHPTTLETERMLARAWRMAGRLESARGLNEDILSRANRAFGHDH